MSVVVRGMKMPKTCVGCVLERGGYCEGFEFPRAIKFKTDHITRMDWCPLIELPPHGRLIDADAFAENLKNVLIRQGYKDTLIGEYLSVDDVIDAIIADLTGKALCGFELNPTIIPADKGETE